MTQEGTIERFEAARGFGFIQSTDGQRQIFFHVRDVRGGAAPAPGQRVRFERIDVGGKGPRAMAVQVLGGVSATNRDAPVRGLPASSSRANAGQATRSRRNDRSGIDRRNGSALAPVRQAPRSPASNPARSGTRTSRSGQPLWFGAALLVWLSMLTTLTVRGGWPVAPMAVLGGLLALNLATFVAYAMDKSAAQQGQWRTPENTLHALALAGGWPAAWLAQRTLRHKSSKAEFLGLYVLTVLLHLTGLGALLWRGW